MPARTKTTSSPQAPQTHDANPDPITGAPGAHPVGTGIGAAGGGAAGAAIGAAVGGPIGAAVGLVAGAVAGGLAGKGTAEAVNPTEEGAYWRENYAQEPYVDKTKSYKDYESAYRTGYEGYSKYGAKAKTFEEAEPNLKTEYEQGPGQAGLEWERARHAARAAWERVSGNLQGLMGYTVLDENEKTIGTVENLWADHTSQPAYLGVRSARTGDKRYVVPARYAQVNHNRRKVKVPFRQDYLEEAPNFDPRSDFTSDMELEVASYYNQESAPAVQPVTSNQTTLQLKEEKVNVRKQKVDAGGVTVRKVVRTETVNQPVELNREELVVERVPAAGNAPTEPAFGEQEVYLPLRREEAVVNKESRVREEVRVGKRAQTDRQTVSETIRKEDVEVERSGPGDADQGGR